MASKTRKILSGASIKKFRSSLWQVFQKLVHLLFNQMFWISALIVGSLLAAIYFLWPDNRKVQAPAIVAASDSGHLIPLKITIINNHDLRLRFNLRECLFNPWSKIGIQKTDDLDDLSLVINGKSLDSIPARYRDSVFTEQGDVYFNLEKNKLRRWFDLEKDEEFYLEYTFKNGLYPRNYSSSFISLLYIPVDYNFEKDDSLAVETEIEFETPHNFILTSSIPDAEKIFVLESGVNYSFKYNRKETGILITVENISATAFKDIIMLFVTTVFGFALGLLIEKWFLERQVKKSVGEGRVE